MDLHIKSLERRLEELEIQLQYEFSTELEAEVLTRTELDVWGKREDIRLSQLAKEKWATEGDQNSQFFHVVVNQRRKASIISRMQLEDGTVL